MELRNYFSLFCLHQETQLIFIYLPITSHILGAFVNSQVQGHREVRESSFSAVFLLCRCERSNQFFLNWLLMKGLIMMDGITGGIISLMDDWSLFTVHMNRWISHTSLRLFICLYWNIYLKTKWSKQVRRLDLNLIFFTQPPIWKGREICSCIIIMKMYHLRLRISLYHGTTVLSVVYRLCYSMWCHFLTTF